MDEGLDSHVHTKSTLTHTNVKSNQAAIRAEHGKSVNRRLDTERPAIAKIESTLEIEIFRVHIKNSF